MNFADCCRRYGLDRGFWMDVWDKIVTLTLSVNVGGDTPSWYGKYEYAFLCRRYEPDTKPRITLWLTVVTGAWNQANFNIVHKPVFDQ